MHTAHPRVAVVLSGCGFLDGAEIHESVSVLVHLARLGARVHCFAPDQDAPSAVDHYTGAPDRGPRRNMLHEAARIARGKEHISPLADLDASRFDAVIFPGGFGAAKNLCTFATEGPACTVLPDVERALKAFHAAGKPIGLCCIAPALAARVFGRPGKDSANAPTITLGPESGAADAARAMGARHVAKPVTEAVTDEGNRIVTTPAYMCEADPFGVFTGIGTMVEGVVRMAASPATVGAR